MLFALFSILSIFLYLPSPLFYCLGLLGVVISLFFWALYYSLFHTLLSLLILILYIGAIMVLISYVSATSPNFLPNFRVYFSWVYYLFALFLLSFTALYSSIQYYFSSSFPGNFSDFFFLVSGVWVFVLLVFFMFIILLVCSFLVVQKGTFRSV